MKPKIRDSKHFNREIKMDNDFSWFINRYYSDIKFLVPWVQDESNRNNQVNEFKEKQKLKQKKDNEKMSQFIEFIESNKL